MLSEAGVAQAVINFGDSSITAIGHHPYGEWWPVGVEAGAGHNVAVPKVADVSDDEMTMDYLLDERIRELYGEESRRFTLVRTGKLIERVKKYNPEARDLIQDFHVLWPIPQAVRDANTGEFPQNPGYEGYEG